MLKKLMFILIMATQIYGSQERISDIKTLSATVEEIAYFQNEKREKTYTIEYITPDYLRRVIQLPKINKGEVYLYQDGKTKVYIPLFDEVIDEGVTNESNDFLEVLNSLKAKDIQDKEFSKRYYEGKVKKLSYKKDFRINLINLKKVDDILIPVKYQVFQNDFKIADIQLKDVKINDPLEKKELK